MSGDSKSDAAKPKLQLRDAQGITALAFGDSLTEGMDVTRSKGTATKLRLHEERCIRILAFGASLVEGYTDYGRRFHPYARALKPKLQTLLPEFKDVNVDVEGQSGDRVLRALSGQFQQRLRAAAPEGETKYDLIIILGGTNDLAYRMGKDLEGAEEIFEEGLKVLYDYVLEKTNASLLVMTVPERAIDQDSSALGKRARAAREHLNNLIKQWVADQKERVFLMDLATMAPHPGSRHEYDDEAADEGIWSLDGLHMSARGYDFVGEELAQVIHGLLQTETEK